MNLILLDELIVKTIIIFLFRLSSAVKTKKNHQTQVVEIGDWDMDATAFIAVAHSLPTGANSKVRSIDVMIRNDGGGGPFPLTSMNQVSQNIDGGIESIDATNVQLSRLTAGGFDTTSFDSTSYNRGWITIEFEV